MRGLLVLIIRDAPTLIAVRILEHNNLVVVSNIGPHGVQEAICIWGITRNTFFAVTRIATEARVEIGGRGGGVTD